MIVSCWVSSLIHFSLSRVASHLFPYVKKRIQVISQTSTELNPIEVAIDEMSKKVSELNQLCTMEEVDMIRLQLKLQGSVSVKVMTISCLSSLFFLNASTSIFILIFIIPGIFCLWHILYSSAVRSHCKHTKEWKIFHWH